MPTTTCPNCGKVYSTDLDPPDNDPRLIQQIFPEAEPWQREQLQTGLCSDKCFDEYLGVTGYTYDEKGRRFKKGVRKLFVSPR